MSSSNKIQFFQTDTDPSTGTGLTAPIGSVAFLSAAPGGAWTKTGSSDTAWSAMVVSGVTVSPITYSRIAATTLITTTSTTDVVVTSQTLTPASGTYLVFARGIFSATTNNRTITLSIYSNGSAIADSAVMTFVRNGSGILGGTSDLNFMATDTVTTVNGSQAIDMRWRTDGGTAQAEDYSLVLIKVA